MNIVCVKSPAGSAAAPLISRQARVCHLSELPASALVAAASALAAAASLTGVPVKQ